MEFFQKILFERKGTGQPKAHGYANNNETVIAMSKTAELLNHP
ncbi:hypothetical protein [Paracoccus sp. S-4012]|nr:hypothetical protein [Paracoccus sp. S-4012]